MSYVYNYAPRYCTVPANAAASGITDIGYGAVSLTAIEDVSGTLMVTNSDNFIVSAGDGVAAGALSYHVKSHHLETINSLFFDGHVEAMQKNSILGPGKTQWRYWTTSSH